MKYIFIFIFLILSVCSASSTSCVKDTVMQIVSDSANSSQTATYTSTLDNVVPKKEIKQIQIKYSSGVTRQDLKNIKNGDSYQYIVDQHNNIHFFQDESIPKITDSDILVNTHPENAGGADQFIKESGKVSFDKKATRIQLEPTYQQDLSDEELEMMMRNNAIEVTSIDNTIKDVSKIPSKTGAVFTKSKFLDCAAIIEAKKIGKNFITDNLISANIVQTTTFLAFNYNKLADENVQRLEAADLAAMNFNVLVGGGVNKALLLKGVSAVPSMIVRTGVGYGLTQMKQPLFVDPIVGQKSKEGSKIQQNFDRNWFLGTIPVNYWIDKQFTDKLPNYLFEVCSRGETVNVLISPRMLRIYQKYLQAFTYFSLRKKFVLDKNK